MKKIIVIAIAILSSNMIFAQKTKDVPAPVKAAFQKQYPNVSKVEWEKEDGNYEAEFDINKIENSVLYDSSGKLLETEMEIQLKDLPAGVLEYVQTNYKGQKVNEAAKITDANGTVTFEAEIGKMDVIFDEKGKFLKEKKD